MAEIPDGVNIEDEIDALLGDNDENFVIHVIAEDEPQGPVRPGDAGVMGDNHANPAAGAAPRPRGAGVMGNNRPDPIAAAPRDHGRANEGVAEGPQARPRFHGGRGRGRGRQNYRRVENRHYRGTRAGQQERRRRDARQFIEWLGMLQQQAFNRNRHR